MKTFPGWKQLGANDFLMEGDRFVWIINDHPVVTDNNHPETSQSIIGKGNKELFGRPVGDFIFSGYWGAFRRESGPIKLPLNIYYSSPLPLP